MRNGAWLPPVHAELSLNPAVTRSHPCPRWWFQVFGELPFYHRRLMLAPLLTGLRNDSWASLSLFQSLFLTLFLLSPVTNTLPD